MVGREAELARLREHWHAARDGAGRVVAIYGPDGIGKTRLAAELAVEIHRDGGLVRYAAGRSPPALAALSRPTLLVLDDADGVELDGRPDAGVLVLVCGRDAEALAGVGATDMRRLGPLEPGAVRELAAAGDVPAEWLLADGDGVPAAAPRADARLGAARGRAPGRHGGWAGRRRPRRAAGGRSRPGGRRAEAAGSPRGRRLERRRRRARCSVRSRAWPPSTSPTRRTSSAASGSSRSSWRGWSAPRCSGSWVRPGAASPRSCGPGCCRRSRAVCCLSSADWAQVVIRPGEHPLRELAEATARVDRRPGRAGRRPVRGDLHALPRRARARRVRGRAGGRARFADRGARDPRRPLRALRRVPGALEPARRPSRARRCDAPRRAAPGGGASRAACRAARRARADRCAGGRRRRRAGRAADALHRAARALAAARRALPAAGHLRGHRRRARVGRATRRGRLRAPRSRPAGHRAQRAAAAGRRGRRRRGRAPPDRARRARRRRRRRRRRC